MPGKPEKSLLIKAIRRIDKKLSMPPKGALPESVVADFVAWVKRGAPDPRKASDAKAPKVDFDKARRFWSFRRIAAAPAPKVGNKNRRAPWRPFVGRS